MTATRGGWSPDGAKYLTLVEFPNGLTSSTTAAVMTMYGLQFPNTEISGAVTLSGAVQVGR